MAKSISIACIAILISIFNTMNLMAQEGKIRDSVKTIIVNCTPDASTGAINSEHTCCYRLHRNHRGVFEAAANNYPSPKSFDLAIQIMLALLTILLAVGVFRMQSLDNFVDNRKRLILDELRSKYGERPYPVLIEQIFSIGKTSDIETAELKKTLNDSRVYDYLVDSIVTMRTHSRQIRLYLVICSVLWLILLMTMILLEFRAVPQPIFIAFTAVLLVFGFLSIFLLDQQNKVR